MMSLISAVVVCSSGVVNWTTTCSGARQHAAGAVSDDARDFARVRLASEGDACGEGEDQ